MSPSLDARLDAILRGEACTWGALRTTAGELLDACEAQEIKPLVHHRVSTRQHAIGWPIDVRQELARAAHAAAAIEMVRTRETTAVLEALASAGVHPLLLKGVPLAHLVYDSPALRAHADTDLLIRRDEVEAVRATLRPLGYTDATMSDGELIFCQFQMIKHDLFGVDHALDIHWKISTQPVFADILSHEELSQSAIPVPSLGAAARAAGDIHALLLACIHPVMHHRNSGRLIWLYDIHLLACRLSARDLDRFATLAVVKDVAGICAHQLARSQRRFGTPVSSRQMATLGQRSGSEPSRAYLRPGRRWHHELASSVRGLPRLRDRLRLLREVVLPGPAFMLDSYRLGGGAAVLLPALYMHRCVRGAWRILTHRK